VGFGVVTLPQGGWIRDVFDIPSDGKILVQRVPRKATAECTMRDWEDSYRMFYGNPANGCFSPDERHRVMQQYLKPLLKSTKSALKVNDDELVIHLCGGDLFGERSDHCQAYQPPCAEYDLVIMRGRFSRVRVVYEDNLYPCLNESRRSI